MISKGKFLQNANFLFACFTGIFPFWGCGHFLGLAKPPIQGSACTPLGSYFQVMF